MLINMFIKICKINIVHKIYHYYFNVFKMPTYLLKYVYYLLF